MDRIAKYREIIKERLTARAHLMRSQPAPGENVVCLFDETMENYILLRFGWVRGKRLHSVTLHLRLINGVVSVEENRTDDFIFDLIDAGIPDEDIVSGMCPPEMRERNEVAIA